MFGKRIIFTDQLKVSFETFEIPPLRAGEVLVVTAFSFVSPGTERAHLIAAENTKTGEKGFPFRPGYSTVGVVSALGDEVDDVQVGDLVAIAKAHQSHSIALSPLASQRAVTSGQALNDLNLSKLSFSLAYTSTSVPLSSYSAFLLASIGRYGAYRLRSDYPMGQTLVTTLGPIGLFAGQYVKSSENGLLIGVTGNNCRADVARRLGFDEIIHENDIGAYFSDKKMANAWNIIDTGDDPRKTNRILEMCPTGTRISLLGSTRGNINCFDIYNTLHRKCLEIYGAHEPTRSRSDKALVARFRDCESVLDDINSSTINVTDLLTHKFHVSDVEAAYKTLAYDRNAIGIVIDWS